MPGRSTDSETPDAVDLEICTSSQEEELQVLESIYPEYVSGRSSDASGTTLKLEIPIELGERTPINFGSDTFADSVSVEVLPPLLIQLILPPTYPALCAPKILTIRAMHGWLPNPLLLLQYLSEMWHTSECILYNWVEYIRTGEFLERLDLRLPPQGGIKIQHPSPAILVPLLVAYDMSAKSNQFSQTSFPCTICLNSVKGSKCLRLSCNHIFCRRCLEDFWKICIEEGDIDRVGCPDPECVKQGAEAGEEDVARVVTSVELQRWKWLWEKRRTDRDPTIILCPVAVCQAPVPKPTDVDAESSWSRLRQCQRCGFSFCAFCKRTWHGPLDKCPIAQYEDIAMEYLGAAEGSEERAKLERRFGKTNIRRLVATYQEDKANLDWLSSSTMMCPGCSCYVEKNLGCNHMTCWRCQQHFCYKCGSRLNAGQPYAHFSNVGLKCFNQLFDEEE